MPNHLRRLRLRYLLPLSALAGLLWSVAPAVSLTPYQPEAVDFEQALPSLERLQTPTVRHQRAGRSAAQGHEQDPVAFRSPVIVAPARFDLVGVGGELRPLEFRARTEGGEWSRWVETANGDPVYFGGADEVQVRSWGVRPVGKLHYVNVSGTATATDRLLTAARNAVSSAFISITDVAVAEAQDVVPGTTVPQPAMVTRTQWGANRDDGGCEPRAHPAYGEVKAGVVHHTVSANHYAPEEAPSIVLGICRFHRNGNGWNDIGYNALVDRFGTLYIGRAGGIGKPVVGAQAQGYNAQTTGMATIGTHTSTPISRDAFKAYVRFLAWKLDRHGVRAEGTTRLVSAGGNVNRYPSGREVKVHRIFGHRRVDVTACPGEALKSELRRMRSRTQERIDRYSVEVPPEDEIPEEGSGGTEGP